MQAQSLNKEVAASVRIEKNSEFLKFYALVENRTRVEFTLEYDFLIYKTQDDGSVVKDSDKQRFVLKPYEKKVLQTLTLGNTVTNKTVIVLLINDKDGKPLGRDRIALEQGSMSNVEDFLNIPNSFFSQDQAKPRDGFILEGLVLQKTITKAGRDFYKYYYSQYYNKQMKSPKNIVIKEIPGRSRSTRITVAVDDVLIMRFFSQPNRKFLEGMADIAINRTVRQLQILERQKDQTKQY